MERPVMSMRNSKTSCCVIGCTNAYYNTDKSVRFYNFPQRPYEQKRKEIWINSVRRINSQTNEPWLPKKRDKICSVHFIGNAKSNIEKSPSYNPTLFPKEYRKTCRNLNSSRTSKEKRFKRLQERYSARETINNKTTSLESVKMNIESQNHNLIVEETKQDFSCQTDIEVVVDDDSFLFECSFESCDAKTQATIMNFTIKKS